MDSDKYLNKFAKFLKEDQLVNYKASAEYSCSQKNKSIYWATSAVTFVFILSLLYRGYIKETWAMIFIVSFVTFALAQQVFGNFSNTIDVIQESQMPKMKVNRGTKNNTEGLKLFMLMSDVKDIIKMERKVVWLAVVQVWFALLINWVYIDTWQGLLPLVSTPYVVIALVRAIYGTMAMYNFKKACRL